MRNGLSHTLYQTKKYTNCQIYDVFGIFGIIPENIANNKSGTLMSNAGPGQYDVTALDYFGHINKNKMRNLYNL